MLLGACASGPEEIVSVKEKPVLKVYLFAPESPIVTRGDIGDVSAAEAEKAIKTVDVWVFESLTPYKPVSYIHLDDISFDGQKEIAMEISDSLANLPKKPDVNVYVAVNASDLGMTLGKATTLAQLREACIGSEYFGVYPDDPNTDSPSAKLVQVVPEGGLPMSGLLENQVIDDKVPPVYTVKTRPVRLVRAVSKVRFVLSKSSSGPPTVSDLTIKLDGGVLPKEEYLFLEDEYPEDKSHVKTTGDTYEAEATLVSGVSGDDINSCANPAGYVYASETGQAYETKIDNGLADPDGDGPLTPDLREVGRFYLRESEVQLTGTISYKVGTGESAVQKSVPFSMSGAGDFTRNHTWIVYGYFLGSGDLKLSVVDVKAWTEDTSNPKVYNW